MPCTYLNPSPRPLDIGIYRRLHQDGKNLIKSWYDKALDQLECDPGQSFEPFIYLWIAFNAWSSCVTGIDQDNILVRRVANCPRLRAMFLDFYQNDEQFELMTNQFADLWPIFRANNIRMENQQQHQFNDRAEYIELYYQIPNIEFKPKCSRYHVEKGEIIPRDWPHTLHTIYQIRCNLFHGEKSPHSEMDKTIVKTAFNVLIGFFIRADIV